MKKSILFVDDEPNILKGLRRVLYPLRKEWEMIFVDNGMKALATMEEKEIGIVISDMRMPGMNGFELLKQVQRHHPEIVRVILTGQPDKEVYREVMTASHYFLWKPSTFEDFEALLNQIKELRTILEDKQLIQKISSITSLPSLPVLFTELTKRINDQAADFKEIVDIINKDMAMTAQILKLANSAFFSLKRKILSLDDAVKYIGLETIRSCILVHHLFSQCSDVKYNEFELGRLWEHSFQVAATAKKICAGKCDDTRVHEEAYLAGLLHDIGKLFLACHLPEEYRQILETSRHDDRTQHEIEIEHINTDHASIGGYLTTLWGLPGMITEAVCFHHRPLLGSRKGCSPVIEAVWYADRLVHGDRSPSAAFINDME